MSASCIWCHAAPPRAHRLTCAAQACRDAQDEHSRPAYDCREYARCDECGADAGAPCADEDDAWTRSPCRGRATTVRLCRYCPTVLTARQQIKCGSRECHRAHVRVYDRAYYRGDIDVVPRCACGRPDAGEGHCGRRRCRPPMPEPPPAETCPHCGGPGWITTIGVRYGSGHDRPGQITSHRDHFRVPCCADLASQSHDK